MSHYDHSTHSGQMDKPQTKTIWKTFWILLGITALEFIVALGLDFSTGLKAAIFIGMTFIKAFYIVAEFMHLKHETKVLMWSIVLPFIFIIWLTVALLVESNSIFYSHF